MAVVEFSIKDLEKLVGRKLTKEDLEDKIPMIGFPLEKIEGDRIYYETFPNRPDVFSAEGFGRIIKDFLGIAHGLKNFDVAKGQTKVHVEKSVKDARPFIVCAVVRNVKFTDELVASLIQVQEKLTDTLGRKRKKVAIGLHDFDKVRPPIYYKAVDPKEMKFVPLDMNEKMSMDEIGRKHPKGIEYIHILKGFKKWPIIVDKNNAVLSFPPIINGELTRVSDKTQNIFIDITGTSQAAIEQALNIIVTSLHERGCKIETVEVVDSKSKIYPNLKPHEIKVDLNYVNKLLDLNLNEKDFAALLGKMGFGFNGKVLVPAFRADIMHPIDIVEDVAIAYGYRNFEPRLSKEQTKPKQLEETVCSDKLRKILIGAGLQEVVTMVLTNKENELLKMKLKEEEVYETANPVSVECTICRKSMTPSLLKVFSQNKHNEYPQKIFEIGDCVIVDKKEETGIKMAKNVACGISNSKVAYQEIASVLDRLLKANNIKFKLKKTSHPSFIPGRAAEILVKNKPVGIIGEVHPQVILNWNLEMPVACFEIKMEVFL